MVEYLLVALFVALEGFFAGSETGFYCLNRIRLHFRADQHWPGAASLRKLTAQPHLAISTMLIGTNISVYLATVLCARKLVEIGLERNADLYSVLIMPPVLLVFAEIIPKSIFRRRADTLMYKAAGMLRVCKLLFSPFLVLLWGVGAILKLAVGHRAFEPEAMFTTEKLRFFLSEGAALGVLSPYQRTMADNILRVKSLTIGAAMVPLKGVVMVSEDASLEELKEVLRDHRFSRIPVYSGDRRKITGTVNVIDVMSAEGKQKSVQTLARHSLSLDGRLSVAEGLYALQRARQQMAVVTTPQGAARGIVTVKDLVEEIVGELRAW